MPSPTRLPAQAFDPGILLLQLCMALSFLGLQHCVVLMRAVVIQFGTLQDTEDIGNGPALDDQLINRFQLADDLPLRRVAGSFHSES